MNCYGCQLSHGFRFASSSSKHSYHCSAEQVYSGELSTSLISISWSFLVHLPLCFSFRFVVSAFCLSSTFSLFFVVHCDNSEAQAILMPYAFLCRLCSVLCVCVCVCLAKGSAAEFSFGFAASIFRAVSLFHKARAKVNF